MKKQGENCFEWRIQGRGTGARSPLDQTEVRRAEKTFSGDRPPPPLSKGPGWPPPHPLSQGLEKSGSEPFLPWFNQEICGF